MRHSIRDFPFPSVNYSKKNLNFARVMSKAKNEDSENIKSIIYAGILLNQVSVDEEAEQAE